jgi:hypothetical protein
MIDENANPLTTIDFRTRPGVTPRSISRSESHPAEIVAAATMTKHSDTTFAILSMASPRSFTKYEGIQVNRKNQK